MKRHEINGYLWGNASLSSAHDYLLPALLNEMASLKVGTNVGGRVFELGCGNGSVANELAQQGWDVTSIDPFIIAIARKLNE